MSSGIGRAAAVVSAGILLSRLLGFGRDVLLYALLGVDAATDLYVAAFTIPDYLFFLLAGGYLSITLVPILSEAIAAGDEAEARRRFTAVFRAVAVLLLGLTVLLALAARPAVGFLFPAVEDLGRLAGLTRIALASQVFFGLGALLMAAQYARRRFLVPTLAPLVYNLGIIAGGAVAALLGDPTPEAFLWGGLAGAAIGNFGLQWWGARRDGMRLVPRVPWRHPALRTYLSLALPLMIGQSVVALDEQWPRLFGQFAGEGAQAALYGARRLNMLPVGVIAQAAGVAAFPFLATLHAEGRSADLSAAVHRSVRGAVAVAALAAAAVAVLAGPIVRVAFQRGEFGAADAELVAPLLAVYALSIPFWAAQQVYTRAFYATRRMWLPVGIGTAVTAITVPGLFLAVDRFGAVGVAAASSASVALYTIGVGVAWRRTAETAEPLAASLARMSAMAVAASAATALVAAFLPEGPSHPVLALVLGAAAAIVAYIGAGRVLRSPEVGALTAPLARLRPRRSSRTGPPPPPAGGR